MSCSKLPLPEISDKAHQLLNFSFPQREFAWEIISREALVLSSVVPIKGGHGYITMLIVLKLSAFRVS